MHALGLVVWAVFAALVGAFVPAQSPIQRIPSSMLFSYSCVERSRSVSSTAQHERASGAARKQPVKERGVGAAYVQRTGGSGANLTRILSSI